MRMIDADKLRTELFDAGWLTDNDEHMVEEIVERQPNVDAVPVRHGRWTVDGECSLCGKFDAKDPFGSEYCPNCGSKMDGGDET